MRSYNCRQSGDTGVRHWTRQFIAVCRQAGVQVTGRIHTSTTTSSHPSESPRLPPTKKARMSRGVYRKGGGSGEESLDTCTHTPPQPHPHALPNLSNCLPQKTTRLNPKQISGLALLNPKQISGLALLNPKQISGLGLLNPKQISGLALLNPKQISLSLIHI